MTCVLHTHTERVAQKRSILCIVSKMKALRNSPRNSPGILRRLFSEIILYPACFFHVCTPVSTHITQPRIWIWKCSAGGGLVKSTRLEEYPLQDIQDIPRRPKTFFDAWRTPRIPKEASEAPNQSVGTVQVGQSSGTIQCVGTIRSRTEKLNM